MSKNPYNRLGGKEVKMGFVEGIKKNYPKEFAIPKYVLFIEKALQYDYKVKLYRPASGVSKYVTVFDGNKKFKVRFSNHKPIQTLEAQNTCDFFVGVTNLHIATSQDAWNAMIKYFSGKKNKND